MITRDAVPTDIPLVLEHLSAQNQSELNALGLTRDQAHAKAVEMLAAGDAVTAVIDGEPVCICGVYRCDGLWQTWFIATDAYFAAGASAVRFSRRFLQTFVTYYGQLWTTTHSDHPAVERWFRVLGYRKVADRTFTYG